MRLTDGRRLGLIVLAGFIARLFTLWIGRAEFTGWFNHTYYYFVEVRGLLDHGRLPYPDMPLLFHLDALVARLLIAVGMEQPAAIVAATRFWMCLLPALISVPAFAIVRTLNDRAPLRPAQWLLVACSSFLPLTLRHMPEIMQKNLFGLLLLAVLVRLSQRWLRRPSGRDVALAGLLLLLIVAAHFGTFAAAVLYGVALLLADAAVHRTARRTGALALGLLASGGAALALIRTFDAKRFGRILEYLDGSMERSLVAALGSAGRERTEVLASLAALLALYALLFFCFRAYTRRGAALPAGERVFWLTNILFPALLLLPIVDERLMSRMVLFLSLPLLVIVAHLERHSLAGPWRRKAGLTLIAVAVVALACGEIVSSRVSNANHAAVLADLEALRARQFFHAGDLILAKTGAEHIANWFFEVEAGVITSLSLADFEKYSEIYVLNPIEGELDFTGLEGITATRETDRYLFMRRSIPRPPEIEPLFESENLELFRLDEPPRRTGRLCRKQEGRTSACAP